jgi:glyoxylase-like metal-dependent hydrolase (beta-lactamase superfamily II)
VIDPTELGVAAQVLSVRYARRQVRRSEVFHDYGSYGLPDATLDMDYNFWVIRDSDGITLVDTGYDVAARDWLGEIPVTSTPDCLHLLGIDPASVTRVVTSHFHYDRPVGGHCPGELLVAVRTKGRPLLLASDAAHFYEQLEHEWPFFAFTDLGEMRRALALINQLARDFGATVVPGHDARTRQRFPALPGAARDVAVVLS